MTDPTLLPFAAAALTATALAAGAGLRAWQDWLALQRERLGAGRPAKKQTGDLTALRARVRRLEAIANGIEL
jgi:hypothetical protein